MGEFILYMDSREKGVYVSKGVSLSPLFASLTAHIGLSWPWHIYIRWKAYFIRNDKKYYLLPRKLLRAICGGNKRAMSIFSVKKSIFSWFLLPAGLILRDQYKNTFLARTYIDLLAIHIEISNIMSIMLFMKNLAKENLEPLKLHSNTNSSITVITHVLWLKKKFAKIFHE